MTGVVLCYQNIRETFICTDHPISSSGLRSKPRSGSPPSKSNFLLGFKGVWTSQMDLRWDGMPQIWSEGVRTSRWTSKSTSSRTTGVTSGSTAGSLKLSDISRKS